MTASTTNTDRYLRPGWVTRHMFNPFMAGLAKLGIGVRGARVLAVRGRTSGEWRTVPVNPLTIDDATYLVAPRGTTEWVRNIRVAGGGELRKGRRHEQIGVVELTDLDVKVPVLRSYLRHWKMEVGAFFDGVGPDAPDAELRRIAPGYPVFRVTRVLNPAPRWHPSPVRWRRRPARAFPDDGEAILARSVADWAYLDPDERATVAADTATLIDAWRWEAANRFDLTDAMCTVIAGQAAWMALGLGLEDIAAIGTIVVHPTTMTSVGSRPGPVSGLLSDEPVYICGEAHYQGPLLLAWDTVRRDTRWFGSGLNVVVHEVTHKLDMLDGIVDGTPPLPADRRDRWAAVCSAEYRALRDGAEDPLLRDYAATDVGEFFATAAEVFFDRPVALAEGKPELYAEFAAYFGADPAARHRRGAWQDRARAHPSP